MRGDLMSDYNNDMAENETITVCGIECLVNDTSALEAWLVMHSFRRVLCGGDTFPAKKGTIAHVASQELLQKEIDFIEEMSATGGCPPLKEFIKRKGIVGVTDFEVVESTDLPGWDGTPNPVLLSNPRWFMDGKLVPVLPDIFIEEDVDESGTGVRLSRRERRLRQRERRRWRR